MPLDEPMLRAAERYVEAGRRFAELATVDAADEVIDARLALQQLFVDDGWTPPPSRRAEMARDRLIVEQRTGIDDIIGSMPC